eukprot:jgi/Mesen1/2581/ME000163S01601
MSFATLFPGIMLCDFFMAVCSAGERRLCCALIAGIMACVKEVVLASSSTSGSITAWDLLTGSQLVTLSGDGASTKSLCCTEDVVLTSQEVKGQGLIVNWAWTEFLSQAHSVTRSFFDDVIGPLSTSRSGHLVAGGSSSGRLYVWEISSGRLMRSWVAHVKAITWVLFSSDDSFLISSGEDTIIAAWPVSKILYRVPDCSVGDDACPLYNWRDHQHPITCLYASNGGSANTFFSCSFDCTCKMWSLSLGQLLCTVKFPVGIHAIVLDPGEHMLFAGASDGRIYTTALQNIGAGVGKSMSAHSDDALVGHSPSVDLKGTLSDGSLDSSLLCPGTSFKSMSSEHFDAIKEVTPFIFEMLPHDDSDDEAEDAITPAADDDPSSAVPGADARGRYEAKLPATATPTQMLAARAFTMESLAHKNAMHLATQQRPPGCVTDIDDFLPMQYCEMADSDNIDNTRIADQPVHSTATTANPPLTSSPWGVLAVATSQRSAKLPVQHMAGTRGRSVLLPHTTYAQAVSNARSSMTLPPAEPPTSGEAQPDVPEEASPAVLKDAPVTTPTVKDVVPAMRAAIPPAASLLPENVPSSAATTVPSIGSARTRQRRCLCQQRTQRAAAALSVTSPAPMGAQTTYNVRICQPAARADAAFAVVTAPTAALLRKLSLQSGILACSPANVLVSATTSPTRRVGFQAMRSLATLSTDTRTAADRAVPSPNSRSPSPTSAHAGAAVASPPPTFIAPSLSHTIAALG